MQDDVVEIDLLELLNIARKHIVKIISLCILCSAIGFAIAEFVIPEKFTATSKIIIVKDENQASSTVTYSDIQLTQSLASTYEQIMMSEAVSDEVINNLELDSKYDIDTKKYNDIVSASTENKTEVMTIKAETISPELSAKIVNEAVDVFIKKVYSIYDIRNVSILNRAKIPEEKSSPSITKYTAIGGLIGLVISAAVVVILSVTDTKVKTEEELKEIFDYPTIGNIPFFEINDDENKVYSEENRKPSSNFVTMLEPDTVAAEGFRILRTNLSLRDFDETIKVINVISAYQQEAKSTTVINLAYVYSQLGKKVLVMDLDLRLPSLHKKYRLRNKLGITDLLNKKCSFADAVIHYTRNYDILLSGTKTVYASELIQSNSFRNFLNELKQRYDIILIDCPPINMVTDGMITSTLADGTILCVASNHDDKNDLIKARDTLKQFDIRMLGIVITMTSVGKKYYSHEYGYGYGYGYGRSSKKSKKPEEKKIKKRVDKKVEKQA